MRVAVFGAGYVGLVTATCLAELGHEVHCIDVDEKRVRTLEAGDVPFFEPSLAGLVRRNVSAGRLMFALALSEGHYDVYFIAVGTPPNADGSADTRMVMAVADTIAEHVWALSSRGQAVIAVKSTVPVGTCAKIQRRVDARGRLDVVSNPEFLKEGDAVRDFFHPDRIVIGQQPTGPDFGWTGPEPASLLVKLYSALKSSQTASVQVTDWYSAELVKYASNAMLAMRVSFMNELSRLCHVTGADIHAVRVGVGTDSRIGNRFLFAGPGYGGSCFPKDVQALVDLGKQHDVPMLIASATHAANEAQASFIARLLVEGLGSLQGKDVAFWGLAFKPETDDVRAAPSVRLARGIMQAGGRVVGHDPEAGANFHLATGASTMAREYEALADADALVLLTEWRCYRSPDFVEVKRRMRGDFVLDARNIWRPGDVRAAGLRYQGVGCGR